MHEASLSTENCFVTLTYDQANLPVDYSLDKTHVPILIRAIRDAGNSVRYFQCGEYGDQNWRPHYHLALFQKDYRQGAEQIANKGPHKLYRHPELEKLWGKGLTSVGELTTESASYIASYITKKVRGPNADSHYEWFSNQHNTWFMREREYTTMSRRPGIGADWIRKFKSDVYPSDEIIINGKKARPPKFYDAQLERTDPGLLKRVKGKRIRDGSKHAENNTPDRLHTRDQLAKRRQNQLKREL